MSTSDATTGQQKYYDPAEVETYVKDVTNTIKTLQARLQEAVRRAEAAEHSMGDQHPETASLGRALLLAGEVADKTIADADIRAAEILRAAEDRAVAIVEAAHLEAQRLVDAAGGAAAELFQKGEARLLAAVSAFMEGSNVLRSALTRIEEDATNWRGSVRSPQPGEAPPFLPPTANPYAPPPATPYASPTAPPYAPPSGSPYAAPTAPPYDPPAPSSPSGSPPPGRTATPDLPGGVHNRSTRNGTPSGDADGQPPRYPVAQPPAYPNGAPRDQGSDALPMDPGFPAAAGPRYSVAPPPPPAGGSERRTTGPA